MASKLDAADLLQTAVRELFNHLRSEESGFFELTPALAMVIRNAYIERVQALLDLLKESWS